MLAFIIGLMVGGTFGIFIIALVQANRYYDEPHDDSVSKKWKVLENVSEQRKKHSSDWNCADNADL